MTHREARELLDRAYTLIHEIEQAGQQFQFKLERNGSFWGELDTAQTAITRACGILSREPKQE